MKFINSSPLNTFPVGTALYHSNFVKLANTGTADNFSVRVVPYVLTSGNNGDTLRAGYVNRTWFIEEQIPGGSNATAEFFWNATDELGGFNRSISRTAHFTSAWQLGDAGAAATDAIGRFSKSQDGFSSFSPFAVTSLNAALPLRLVQFTASKQGGTGLLQWQTTNEVATKEFVVQYSTNGSAFTGIGVIAANNRPGTNNYHFTDNNLQPGNNYYRVKMTDSDGQFSFSDTRIVKMETAGSIRLFPNPAHQFVTISGLTANGSLELLTMDGKLLEHFITTGSSLLINVNKLAGGIYIIQYRNHGKQEQQKLLKE